MLGETCMVYRHESNQRQELKNMNIIICDDRIDDRKNVSDLLSDYGEKKNYELLLQNMILENSYAKNNRLWKRVSYYFWTSICRGWMG